MYRRWNSIGLAFGLFLLLTSCNGRSLLAIPRTAVDPIIPTPVTPPQPTIVTIVTTRPTAVHLLNEGVDQESTAVRPALPAVATPSPSPTPIPILVNGIPTNEFVILSSAVLAHSRQIFAKGQEMGRDPHVFSKVGDSVALTTHFLNKFDDDLYKLGEYADLQHVIDHFAGSYGRYGVAIRVGLHAYAILDPAWASKKWCEPNESMLACEIRLNNPSILIIRVGSNDNIRADSFDKTMREVVQQTIDSGVIPVIATKADRFEGFDDRNNQILRQITADFHIPLWDFDHIADTLPNRGLGPDRIHLTLSTNNDYTQPQTFQLGYPVSDLTALLMLDALLTQVIEYEG